MTKKAEERLLLMVILIRHSVREFKGVYIYTWLYEICHCYKKILILRKIL